MNLLPVFQRRNSGEIARRRLKLLLVSDKTNCSPEVVEMIREDMIGLFSKYVEIDPVGVEIQMTQRNEKDGQKGFPMLSANIPIKNVPRP